jgi:phage terminase large subunit
LRNAAEYITTGYTPRELQAPLHASLQRFNVIVCHRRWGKTVFSVNELLDQALRCTRENPQYAYVAPTYGQAERIAWDMLKKYSRTIPGVIYNESKLTCTIPRPHLNDRIKIMLLGAENPDSIRGIYLDGVILDEFAEMDPRLWGEVVRPALADRKGWSIFIGTPKGQNHFYDVYKMALRNQGKGWYSVVHKASTSKVLPIEEIEAMKLEMSEEQIEQELECSFAAALIGSYYGKLITEAEAAGRIGKVPHDPGLLVDTFWDLGVSDTTTIWFIQQFRNEVRVIDYLEMSGEGLDYYAACIKGQKQGHEHRLKYNYRDHEWPHDGKARDLTTGRERHLSMKDLGVRVNVNDKHDKADQIHAARMLIPRCYFDIERCSRGLESLKNYQRKYDSKNKIFTDKPLHNWASHGADSFMLAGMVLKPGEDRQAYKKNLPRSCESDYDVYNY